MKPKRRRKLESSSKKITYRIVRNGYNDIVGEVEDVLDLRYIQIYGLEFEPYDPCKDCINNKPGEINVCHCILPSLHRNGLNQVINNGGFSELYTDWVNNTGKKVYPGYVVKE